MSNAVAEAFSNVFDPFVLTVIVLAAIYGLVVGSIPGLTATMAVALLVPLTFFLDEVPAIAAIVTLEACAIFAGDIPTVLLRIPGTPSSAAYADDAYALTRKGKSAEALSTALLFSVAGGFVGIILLITLAPQLAKIAFYFSTYEYFWLTLLGLSCAAVVSRGSRLKGALALIAGLLLSTVGLSAVHSTPRFTVGRDELLTGINFIPALIGLFGVSEVLRNVARGKGSLRHAIETAAPDIGKSRLSFIAHPFKTMCAGALPMLLRRKAAALRSSLIGSFVGMLPGAGADIGAWISYGVSKRGARKGPPSDSHEASDSTDDHSAAAPNVTAPDAAAASMEAPALRGSDTPSTSDDEATEGLADATSANNAALAGAWVPTLVFGIPGDSITAIVIGVLLMKNVAPGPEIFTNQSALVYSIYLTFILANILLIPLGLLAVSSGRFLVRVPRRILLPTILLFCIVGAYALNGSYADVWIMLAMGVLGFLFERWGLPLGPVVLALLLGGRLEEYFIQNLTKSDSLLQFFARPIAAVLGVVTLAIWLGPPVLGWLRRSRR